MQFQPSSFQASRRSGVNTDGFGNPLHGPYLRQKSRHPGTIDPDVSARNPETLRKQRESQRDESSNSTSTHSHPENQWCPSKKNREVKFCGLLTGCHSITRATEQRWGKEKRPTSLPGSRDVWRDTSLSKAAGYMYLKKTIHEVLTLRPGYHRDPQKIQEFRL